MIHANIIKGYFFFSFSFLKIFIGLEFTLILGMNFWCIVLTNDQMFTHNNNHMTIITAKFQEIITTKGSLRIERHPTTSKIV